MAQTSVGQHMSASEAEMEHLMPHHFYDGDTVKEPTAAFHVLDQARLPDVRRRQRFTRIYFGIQFILFIIPVIVAAVAHRNSTEGCAGCWTHNGRLMLPALPQAVALCSFVMLAVAKIVTFSVAEFIGDVPQASRAVHMKLFGYFEQIYSSFLVIGGPLVAFVLLCHYRDSYTSWDSGFNLVELFPCAKCTGGQGFILAPAWRSTSNTSNASSLDIIPVDGGYKLVERTTVAANYLSHLSKKMGADFDCRVFKDRQEAAETVEMYFGIWSIMLFMSGSFLLTVAELAKISPFSSCVAKKSLNIDTCFDKASQGAVASWVAAMNYEISIGVTHMVSHVQDQDRIFKLQEAMADVQETKEVALDMKQVAYEIRFGDFFRSAVHAVCTCFALALWMVFDAVEIQPCLRLRSGFGEDDGRYWWMLAHICALLALCGLGVMYWLVLQARRQIEEVGEQNVACIWRAVFRSSSWVFVIVGFLYLVIFQSARLKAHHVDPHLVACMIIATGTILFLVALDRKFKVLTNLGVRFCPGLSIHGCESGEGMKTMYVLDDVGGIVQQPLNLVGIADVWEVAARSDERFKTISAQGDTLLAHGEGCTFKQNLNAMTPSSGWEELDQAESLYRHTAGGKEYGLTPFFTTTDRHLYCRSIRERQGSDWFVAAAGEMLSFVIDEDTIYIVGLDGCIYKQNLSRMTKATAWEPVDGTPKAQSIAIGKVHKISVIPHIGLIIAGVIVYKMLASIKYSAHDYVSAVLLHLGLLPLDIVLLFKSLLLLDVLCRMCNMICNVSMPSKEELSAFVELRMKELLQAELLLVNEYIEKVLRAKQKHWSPQEQPRPRKQRIVKDAQPAKPAPPPEPSFLREVQEIKEEKHDRAMAIRKEDEERAKALEATQKREEEEERKRLEQLKKIQEAQARQAEEEERKRLEQLKKIQEAQARQAEEGKERLEKLRIVQETHAREAEERKARHDEQARLQQADQLRLRQEALTRQAEEEEARVAEQWRLRQGEQLNRAEEMRLHQARGGDEFARVAERAAEVNQQLQVARQQQHVEDARRRIFEMKDESRQRMLAFLDFEKHVGDRADQRVADAQAADAVLSADLEKQKEAARQAELSTRKAAIVQIIQLSKDTFTMREHFLIKESATTLQCIIDSQGSHTMLFKFPELQSLVEAARDLVVKLQGILDKDVAIGTAESILCRSFAELSDIHQAIARLTELQEVRVSTNVVDEMFQPLERARDNESQVSFSGAEHAIFRQIELARLETMASLCTCLQMYNGRDFGFARQTGKSPLHLMAEHGSQSELRDLASMPMPRESWIEARDNEARTPLHLAALRGVTSNMQVLLHALANPNAISNGGNSPLHYAASFCCSLNLYAPQNACTAMLLLAKADLDKRNRAGQTAEDIALVHANRPDSSIII